MFDTCAVGVVAIPANTLFLEGFVAWTATDTYNPRDLNPHAPIRFYSLLLFRDGFESGHTSAWSTTSAASPRPPGGAS
jgi:hypothetical protein